MGCRCGVWRGWRIWRTVGGGEGDYSSISVRCYVKGVVHEHARQEVTRGARAVCDEGEDLGD